MSAPTIEVRGLWKSYRRRAVLRGLDFAAGPGEAVAVIGPNGAGKSTFLGCITGDRRPDRGEVRLCGIDPFSDLTGVAGCIGFVPEQPFLYGELAVGEMLRFVAEARRIPAERAAAETGRLLAMLGMEGSEGLLCRELSQGMGRKIAILCAILHRPRVLVLDEAFNGLDRTSAQRLTAELSERRAAGATILLSSHDLGFLAEWCGRGLFLPRDGEPRVLDGDEWERWRVAPGLDGPGS